MKINISAIAFLICLTNNVEAKSNSIQILAGPNISFTSGSIYGYNEEIGYRILINYQMYVYYLLSIQAGFGVSNKRYSKSSPTYDQNEKQLEDREELFQNYYFETPVVASLSFGIINFGIGPTFGYLIHSSYKLNSNDSQTNRNRNSLDASISINAGLAKTLFGINYILSGGYDHGISEIRKDASWCNCSIQNRSFNILIGVEL